MMIGKWLFAAAAMLMLTVSAAEFTMATQTYKDVAFANGVFARKIDTPVRFCEIGFKLDEMYDEYRILTFEYRVTDPEKLDYVACVIHGPGKKEGFFGFTPKSEWTLARVPYAKMKSRKFTAQDKLNLVRIYGRINNSNPAAPMSLEIRNLKESVVPGGELRRRGILSKYTAVKDGVIVFDREEPTRLAGVYFSLNEPYRKGRKLVFDYRVTDPEKYRYVAIAFSPDGGKRWTFDQVKPAAEWTTAVVPFSKMYYTGKKGYPKEGETFNKLHIYGRIPDESAADSIHLELRNIRVEDDLAYNPLDGVQKTYSAYPLFDWKKRADAVEYELQYNDKCVRVKDAFYVPDEPLKPGLVEYTVRALPSGKTVEKRTLYITERHVAWKRPELDVKTFAAKPRPRFRERVALLAPDVKTYATKARNRIGEPLPPDGKDYTPGDPRYKSRIDWKRVVIGEVNRTAARLNQIGIAAILTGDADLVAEAKRLAVEVALKWDVEKGASSPLLWDTDLSSARVLRGVARCFDAAYNSMTPEERKLVADNIRRRGDLFWKKKFPFRAKVWNNHAWDNVDAFTVAALALAEEPEMQERIRYSADLYAYVFMPEMGFEGENNEGLEYWGFGLTLLVNYVNDMKYTVGLDFYQQPWLRQTARFPMYGMPAYGYPIGFGDNHIQMGAANHSCAGPMDREFTSTLGAEAGDGEVLWYTGYPEKNGVKAVFPDRIPQSRFYAHIGETFFNTFLADGRENVAVGFHSGACFAGHQHADQNSFVINAYGDKLAIDGGYYDWFGSAHFRAYSTQTVAHNSILVDGQGQPVRKKGLNGNTTGFFDSPGFGAVSGEAAATYPGKLTRYDRDVIFVKPDYVFVFDRLAAEKASRFDWLIHAHTNDPVPVAGRKFHIRRRFAEMTGTMLLPQAVSGKCAKSYDVDPVLYYSSVPAPRIQPEWTVIYTPEKKGNFTEFLCAMQIGKPGMQDTEWLMEESADAVLVQGKGVKVLFNRTPGKVVRLGGFETDCRYAAVVEQDGKIFDLMKCGGKVFKYLNTSYGESGKDFALRKKNDIVTPGKWLLDGKDLQAKLHHYQFAFGRNVYALECIAEFPEDTVLSVETAVPGNLLVAHGERHWGEKTFPGNKLVIPVKKGKNILSFATDTAPGEVRFSTVKNGVQNVIPAGADWQIPAGALRVEAECPEQENRPRHTATAFPEGGYYYGNWGCSGRFSEWEVPAPEAGEYRVYIRHASALNGVETFRINNRMALKDHAVQFPATGGWKDFQWSMLPQKVKLEKGMNILKMIAVSGSINMDCFILVRE
ncbi:MAG: DUF4962 domain-containing protein [Lentisphaeria bacterium]|nr:DUF4962 domain-containing protein [Lentisphaeria bacterium]